MKVLLVDADSKKGFPNLALMKLSAYHKNKGHNVDLIKGIPTSPPLFHYDKSYISVIFHQNRERALNYAQMLSNCTIGGSGLDLKNILPQEIENIMPDYSLYNIDYSMGFTSRGCIRKCGFCIVPEKEGMIRNNVHITEFLHPDHKKVILLDNNFLASPKWESNLNFIIANKIKVNFNQGLDFRTLTPKSARLLGQTKTTTWHFNTKRLSFAFDNMKIESKLRKGIELLSDYGLKSCYIHIYVLVGYNTTIEEDLYRVEVIKELGAHPYIMRYNQTKGEYDILMHLSRWVNRRIYRNTPFEKYDYAKSLESYAKTFGKFCMHGVDYRGG